MESTEPEDQKTSGAVSADTANVAPPAEASPSVEGAAAQPASETASTAPEGKAEEGTAAAAPMVPSAAQSSPATQNGRTSRGPAASSPSPTTPKEVVNKLPAQGTVFRSASRAAAAPSPPPAPPESQSEPQPRPQPAPEAFAKPQMQSEPEPQPDTEPEQRAKSPAEDLVNDVENVNIQVRDLKVKNADLLMALEHSQQEADMLRDLADAATQLHQNDKQSMKIIELSRKNRALHLAVEREKQKAVNMAAELDMLKRASLGHADNAVDAQGIEEACRSVVEQAAQGAEEAHKEAARWKERWESTLNKMNQQEVKMNAVRQEKEKLLRALQREVGEDVPIAKLLDGTSDWRGRQQQISLLKEKIKEMSSLQGTTVRGAEPTRFDTQHRSTLETIKGEKQREIDRMAAELDAAQQAREEMKLRFDALCSRKAVVEAEAKGLRDKIAILLEKTANDDKLISALRTELSAFKRTRRASGDASSVQLMQRLDMLERQQADQLAQIGRQEKIIWSLQAAQAGQ